MQDVQFDFTGMLAKAIGIEHGVTDQELGQLESLVSAAGVRVSGARKAGALHFMELPYEAALIDDLVAFREEMSWVKTFVVLGIGGSALGAIALHHTFAHLPTMGNGVAFHCFDNVDPEELSSFFQTVDLSTTLFNVVSKSGSTMETAAGFLYTRQVLKERFGDAYTRHLVFTTSQTTGLLKDVGKAEQVRMFTHPDDVGGRFSILSIVGLLPAVFLGLDARALLAGAARMDERCQLPFHDNPAQQFAALQYASYAFKRQNVVVMMPYSYRLKRWPEWFKQLWGESLGKKEDRQGKEVRVGQTPTESLGTTDQHSQIQLFNFGPHDKNIVFLEVGAFSEDLAISDVPDSVEELGYLKGATFSKLMAAELRGTMTALRENQQPTSRITFPEVSEHAVGQFIFMMEYAAALSGELYDINAFDQPGVELGKDFAYALLGRSGYDHLKARLQDS